MVERKKLNKRRSGRCLAYMLTLVMVVCVFFTTKENVNAATSVSAATLPKTLDNFKVTDTFTVRPGGQQCDRDYIQRPLNQAQYSNGGITKIVLTKGTYYVDASLIVYSNTWIYAEDGVTIINTNMDNAPLIVNGVSVGNANYAQGGYDIGRNIFITGGIWDGNKSIKTSYNPIMMLTHCSNVIVSGCTFQNSVDHMLNLSGTQLALVENCTFKDQKRLDSSMNNCPYFDGYTTASERENRYMSCEALHVDFTNKEGESGSFLDGTPPKDITIKDCTFTNVFRGIGTHHNADTSNTKADNYATGLGKSITIKNNTFNNVMGSCISAFSYTNVLISGNTSTNCGQFVNFNGSNNCEVSGTNTVTGSYQATSPYDQHQLNIENSSEINITGVTATAGKSYTQTHNLYISDSKSIKVSGAIFSQAKNYAVLILNSSGVTLDSKCNIKSGGKGSLDIEGSSDVTVNGVTVTGAIYIKNASANLSSNSISGGSGISITGGKTTDSVIISKNTIKNSSTQGVHVYSYKGKTEITGNTISDISNHAIFGSACSNLTIKNNKFSNVKNHVINLESVTNSQVLSNTFGALASGKKGLRIKNSKGITVGSNNLSKTGIIDEDSSNITYLYADISYTGVTKYSGSWYYVKKGVVDTTFTGFAKYGSDWYYVEKGYIPLTTTTVAKGTVNGTSALWYVKNSKVSFTNTVAKNSDGWYGIVKGKVDYGFSGYLSDGTDWWYVEKGILNFTKTGVYKGTINGKTGWYYCEGSKFKKTSVIGKNPSNNTWWRITDGTLDFSFTGFYKNDKGLWYCKNGQIDFTRTGVYKGTINGKTGWYYVKSGQYSKETVIAKNPSNNTWWRVKDGTLDFGFTGFYQNDAGMWYCKNGQIDFTRTGVYKGTINGKTGWYYVKSGKYSKETVIAKNPSNNTWWRVKDGTLDFSFTGFYQNDAGWWYCKNGQITFSENGIYKGTINGVTGYYYVKAGKYTEIDTVAKNSAGYWCVKKGMVDFNFTGIWSNSSGSWYCEKGLVQLNYSGTIVYNGKTYKISGGKVQ